MTAFEIENLRREVFLLRRRLYEHDRDLRGKIILDKSKDPDPHGYHGISLIDRLRAMGWSE